MNLNFFFMISVVNQIYDPEVMSKEYVIRGNTAVLKCSIPSFVADFVFVESWLDEDGTVYTPSDKYGLLLHFYQNKKSTKIHSSSLIVKKRFVIRIAKY